MIRQPGQVRSTMRTVSLAAACVLAGGLLLAGCGSSKSTSSATRSTNTVPSPTGATIAKFTACMGAAGWQSATVALSDRAALSLGKQPGYGTAVVLADKHGDRVAVAFFTTVKQAEQAEVAVGEFVGGKGHAAATPDAAIAWINYAGRPRVDKQVAKCGTSANR